MSALPCLPRHVCPATTDYRAKTLKEAFRLCDVDPLSGPGLERYYVDLAPVRKTEAIEGVNTVLEFQEAGDFCTILFTGHWSWQRGSVYRQAAGEALGPD